MLLYHEKKKIELNYNEFCLSILQFQTAVFMGEPVARKQMNQVHPMSCHSL